MVFVTEGEAIVKAIVLLKIRYTTILKPFMMTKMKMNTLGVFNLDFQEITGTWYSVMNLSSQKYNIGHIPFQNGERGNRTLGDFVFYRCHEFLVLLSKPYKHRA